MLKAVIGAENPVSEYQTKNVGRWIFISDKWKLPSLVRQDKSRNKLMSNPACNTDMNILKSTWQIIFMQLVSIIPH